MIAYSLAIFSAAEMKKPKPRRESKVQLLEVPAMTEWVVFQMRLNVLIANTLYPTVAKIDYSKYEAIVSVPGNPRVNNCYPYPYPSKPLPSLRGKGYHLGG